MPAVIHRRQAAGAALALALPAAGVLAGSGALAVLLRPVPDISPPAAQPFVITAAAVGTREGTVSSRRRGRVTSLLAAPGDSVSAGDPLAELVDLGLAASKAELDERISALRASGGTTQGMAEEVRSQGQGLRRAALRQLENSYELARRDFERWKALHEGGLAARLEFEQKEREFAELGERLAEARSLAKQTQMETREAAVPRASPELRRAERLRQRLDQLSASFIVRSPWDGTVLEMHVAAGEAAPRGTALVTLLRAVLPRLEARAPEAWTITSIRSACGLPGPLPFAIRDGVLSLTAPDASVRPGNQCEVVAWVREQQVTRLPGAAPN